MRQRLNLDMTSLDRLMMLIHGDYGSGKTHLIGDMLAAEAARGPVAFLNTKGEDGYMSLAAAHLGEIGESVETVADFRAALGDLRKLKLRAVAVDSLKYLCRIVTKGEVGDRIPRKDDWGPVHFQMESLVTELRSVAPVVVCVCPSDKSVNQLTGETKITPDLPGREAAGSAGWFDFVGYMQADTRGPSDVSRTITFTPSTSIITRQRLPVPILEVLQIPAGAGGWRTIIAALERGFCKGDKTNGADAHEPKHQA